MEGDREEQPRTVEKAPGPIEAELASNIERMLGREIERLPRILPETRRARLGVILEKGISRENMHRGYHLLKADLSSCYAAYESYYNAIFSELKTDGDGISGSSDHARLVFTHELVHNYILQESPEKGDLSFFYVGRRELDMSVRANVAAMEERLIWTMINEGIADYIAIESERQNSPGSHAWRYQDREHARSLIGLSKAWPYEDRDYSQPVEFTVSGAALGSSLFSRFVEIAPKEGHEKRSGRLTQIYSLCYALGYADIRTFLGGATEGLGDRIETLLKDTPKTFRALEDAVRGKA